MTMNAPTERKEDMSSRKMDLPATFDAACLQNFTAAGMQRNEAFLQHAYLAEQNRMLVQQVGQAQESLRIRMQLLAMFGTPPGLSPACVSDETKIAKNHAWDESTACSSSHRSLSPVPSGSLTPDTNCGSSFIGNEPAEIRTSIILRNLVKHCTRSMLIGFMDRHGFHGKYDLLYIPRCFTYKHCFHYAFLNFVKPEIAMEFQARLHGCPDADLFGNSSADISWSGCQGLQTHIAKYRNSSVMHANVDDECRPLLFRNGKIIPFPKPTKKIKEDRRIRNAHSDQDR